MNILARLAVFLGASVLVACGGSSGSGGGAVGGSIRTTPVTTNQQGGQASYSGAQAALIADVASTDSLLMALEGRLAVPANLRPTARTVPGSGVTAYDRLRAPLANVIHKHRTVLSRITSRATPQAVTSASMACAVSGSYDYVLDTGLFSQEIRITYNNCNDNGSDVWNGFLSYGIRISGANSAEVTLRMGNGDGLIEADDLTVASYNGATLLSTSTFSLDYRIAMSALLQTEVDYRLQLHGAFQSGFTPDAANGAEASKTYHGSYNRFDVRTTWDNTTTYMTKTVKGGLAFSQTDNAVSPAAIQSVSLDYQKMLMTSQINASGNVELTLNGTVTSDFTPDHCYEGTFTFATLSPLVFDATTGQAVAGHLTINGTVHVIFNSDGSLSVSTDGGSTYVTYTRAELEGICLLPLH